MMALVFHHPNISKSSECERRSHVKYLSNSDFASVDGRTSWGFCERVLLHANLCFFVVPVSGGGVGVGVSVGAIPSLIAVN